MHKLIRLISTAFLLLSSASLLAQGTRTWEQSKFEEFEKGTPKGVAIRSDGFLELAPSFRPLATTQSTYLWAITSDDRGNVFAAAGAPSRVYRVTPEGNVSVVLAPPELQVQALVADKSGAIYAATSPDGKVYRIARKTAAAPSKSAVQPAQQPNAPQTTLDPDYSSSVFFDPKTKYIWALALDNDGRLYVATGDRGEIFRVSPDGTSSQFFKSDDAHIRAIEFDKNGNLIAGSDGSGLIYRITPNGEGFVLYSAPKKEITALAIDTGGNIYAAAAGDKKAAAPSSAPVTVSPQPIPMPNQPVPQNVPLPQIPVPGLGATGSEIYRIAPDGSPKRLWTSRDDLVYALAFDQEGRLLAGTGNKGKIYGIGSDGQFSDMLKASANQVIGFARAPKGALYAATSNLGKLFVIEDSAQRDGTFESDVFDAHIFSRWGRAEVRSRGNVEFFARSGNVDNPDRNWSTWKKVDLLKDPVLEIPAARYMQWRAVLHSGTPAPQVDSVDINYLAKNVAPEIDEISVQVGYRYPANARTISEVSNSGSSGSANIANAAPSTIRDRDSIAVNWRAHDENDDQLSFAIYYRGDNETRWKLLKDDLADRFYTFESGLLPDGGYTIRVVTSDAPSHSPDDTLTGSRESTRFEVDNTPPVISNLAAVFDGDNLHITFTSTDSFSAIRRAEFSIDAADWQFVAPVGGLSDAKTENYDVTVPFPHPTATDAPDSDTSKPKSAKKSRPVANPAAEEHVVVVRTFDRFDNMGSAKVVVRPR